MNVKMTKAELVMELQAAQRRIAELEYAHSKSVEQAPMPEEALFRQVFHANPCLMALTDLHMGEYVEVNEAYLKTLGFTRAEIIGKTAAEINLFVDSNQREALLERMKRQGHLQGENVLVRSKTGEVWHGILAGEYVRVQGQNLLLTVMNDVTESKQAEAELQKSEAYYRALVANANDMIIVIDMQGRVTFASPASELITGYTVDELIGRDFRETAHPDDLLEINLSFANRSRVPGTAPAPIKVRVLHKDGEWRSVEALGTNMLDDPVVRGIVLNVHDISEQERVNAALRANEANYRNLVENSESAIAVINRAGDILFANTQGFNIWQDTQIIGKNIYDIYPREYADRYLQAIQLVIDTNSEVLDEAETMIAGRLMWFRLSMAPLKNPDGTVSTLLLNAWDITERKRAEDALRTSERVLRLFVEHSPASIAMFDREMRYIAVSRRYLQDYNLGDQDLVGRSHYEVFPEINERWKQVHQRCLNGATERAEEDPFLRPDGHLDWVHWEIHPWYEQAGKVGGIILFSEVITERKVAQERLRESEERYHQFISQSFEGFLRTEFDQPVDISLPVEEQIDQIYESAYLAEANQAMADTYNIPIDGLVGMRLIDAHGGMNNPDNREAFRKLIAAQYKSINGEVIRYRMDGRPIWLLKNMVGTVKDGRLIRLWETAIDITDRKLAEQSLLESEVKYRTLINSTSDGVFVAQDEKIVFCNAALPAMLGYTPDEFKDMPFARVVAPEHLNIWTRRFHQRISGEAVISNYQVQLMDKSGTKKIWVELRANHITYDRHPAVLGIVRDVTDQRQILEQIESLAKFPAENPDPTLRIDFNGKLLYANEASFAMLTEWTLEEGKPAPAELINVVSLVLESGRDKTIETVHQDRVVTLNFILLQHGGYINIYGRDITEQRHAEEKLRIANERFNELAENVADIFWISEPVTRKNLYVSPAFTKIIGRSVEDVENLPNRFLDVLIHEDQPILVRERELEDSGFKTDLKYRIRRPDGSIRWLHDKGTPVLDKNGKVIRVVGIASDITEQVEAERRVNESEVRFRQIAETIPEVFWIFDNSRQQLLYISPAYETIWGQPVQGVYENNRLYLQTIHPEDRHNRFAALKRQTQSEETEIQYRITRPDGSVRWILDRSFPVLDEENGSLLRTIGIATDITERKQAEDALRDSEERLRLSIAASHQGLYDLNVQTGDAFVNREYAEMLGYEPETFVETFQNFIERLHPDDEKFVSKAYSDYLNGLNPEFHVEFRQKTKDGKWKWALSTGRVVELDSDGKPIRLIGTHTDIDALKQAEVELQRRASQLTLINDVASEITGVLDIQGVLDLSARLVHESFGYHHVGLFTMNEEKTEMVMRSRSGKYAHLFPSRHHVKLGEGIVGTAGERGEMVITNQVTEDAIYRNFFPEVLNTISELGLPFKIAGRVIGVLDVQSPQPNAFDLNDIQVLQTLADQVAIALENARLYESVRKELAERKQAEKERQVLIRNLETLVEAGRALSEPLDPKRIYPLAYRYIANAVPCDSISVSSYNPTTKFIKYEYLHTAQGVQNVFGVSLEASENSPQSRVIRSSESLLLPDYESVLKTITTDTRSNEKTEDIKDSERPRSAIIVPLKINGVSAGTLEVFSAKPNAHTQDHLRFMEALAYHVSAALSNARLFSELEERVRQRTAEVQDLYDNAPAGYYSLDADGKIMLINQTELNWLGYTREEVIGRNISHFLTRESLETFQESFSIFKSRGSFNNLELEMRRKDGTTFPVLINATAIKDEDGNYLTSRSTIFDNTERRKAELALRESEEQNRLLFEESPEAGLLFDQAGVVVRMNHALESLAGVQNAECIGRAISEIGILSKDQTTLLANSAINTREDKEDSAALELKLTHASGELRDISARIFTLNLQGKRHYLASLHDITIRNRAEETMRLANAEMERALRLKDEFLANMSHELRTPLNAILGITESLLEQVSGTLNEKQQKYLQTVLESAQHLLELINDILDLAKINAGRIELDISKVNVQSIAQSSLRMIRELAQKKGLNVKLYIDPTVKTVWADERRLKQMLVNLLSNAVKFTPKDGHIGLDIYGDRGNNVLRFTIWDTGIGINQQDLHLIFRPFVQLDAGLSRGSQGTGLGLVLVSQMARLHGGSVSVESESDGSRFIIAIPWKESVHTAPLIEPRLTEQKAEPPSTVRNDSPKILIVEDTEAVIMLVSDYLKLHGFQVITAKDGFEGVARAKEANPDLILMDVMMPEMDGLETTRRIRDQLGMKDVPIIALTALAMAGDRERCLAAGMNDYLSKPVRLKELLTTIEKNLNPNRGDPR